jgi:arginase
MSLQVLSVPYDSGHRGERMGRGPLHLLERGVLDVLRQVDPGIGLVPVASDAAFPTEIGTAFELHQRVAEVVAQAAREGDRALVLSGNCNSSLGTVAGLQLADPDTPVGVVWFDGHGDCNTPETFTGDFLDAMGLSTLTGRCWQALAATVPGFHAVPDERVILIGAHGADPGALGILADSRMRHIPPQKILTLGVAKALDPALAALAASGVARVYVHLDLDVLDAAYAPANGFAPAGGLLPDHVAACLDAIARRFTIAAAAVASYDPDYDRADRILSAALRFLALLAAAPGPPDSL